MLTFRPATEPDLTGILELQAAVHRHSVDAATAAREGYVSWRHDLPTLRRFNEPVAHSVGVDEDGVVRAYALSMDPGHADAMPEARAVA